jgi:hypothetical protein
VPVYRVQVDVSGLAIVIVEAENEDEACRVARRRAELGDTDSLNADYTAVGAVEVHP